MQLQPARRREVVVQRLPHQLVGEGVAARRPRDLGDDAHGDRFLEHAEQPGRAQAARALEQDEVELAADHGGDAQDRDGLGRQAGHAAADQRADLLRDAQEGILDRVVERPLGRELPDDLTGEEGVAAGDLVQAGDHARGRPRAGHLLHVRRDVGGSQPAQGDPPSDAREFGERFALLAYPLLVLAVGRHEQHPGLRERLAEEAEQQQRRLVARMHVIQRDQQRAVA
jgi:hypothetical protein